MLLCELINMRARVYKPVDGIYIVHITNAIYIVGILAVRFDTGYYYSCGYFSFQPVPHD